MFWKSKESRQKGQYQKAFAQIQEAAPEIASSWSYFSEAIAFKPEVMLFDRVKAFSFPQYEWAKKNYPELASFPFTYFSALLLGVWLSGTTSKDDVETLAEQFETTQSVPRLAESVKFWTRQSD